MAAGPLELFDKLWHKMLRRPYKLARPVDTGQGPGVVLLHGIGRSGVVWQHVVRLLAPKGVRVVAFDLLGFGASPKPGWPEYNVDDHAKAVIASLRTMQPNGQVLLVGHSMGCLVALRVARLRPDLVRHLVLYEMPLYSGLPEKRRYKLRTNLYLNLYKRITRYQPRFNTENLRRVDRLASKIAGLEVTQQTWGPFVKSLQNTIINQTAPEDIKNVAVPMDVVYGTFDMLVIRGKPQHVFGRKEQIAVHKVRARHVISIKASRFLVGRIVAALETERAYQGGEVA